jgi:SAM-dependent methyltransferase
VQINPQPLPEEIRRRYDVRCGKDYLAYELANEKAFLRLQLLSLGDARFWELETALREAPGPMRVLDIGCATGSLLAFLRERGWSGTGLEISGPQADYARRERKLEVWNVPVEENQFPPASFEVIHASHLIEHLNHPRPFLREVRRLLAPGGVLILTTPNIDSFQARLFGCRWRSAIFDHLYLFSVRTLSRLLSSEGFVPERIVTWGGLAAGLAPGPVKRLLDMGAKRFGFGDVMLIRARP